MQILHNLYQVGGDMMGLTFDGEDAAYRDGNSYVINTGQGLILFDCGCGDTWPQIEENIKYWNLDPAEIRYCVLTHAHYDHAAAGHILKARGVHMVAHTNTAESVATGDERCCGYLYHKEFTSFEVDTIVNDGDTIELCGLSFNVMHLPGHSAGCTAFFFQHDNKRVVVSGDVIGTLLDGHFGWSGSIDFDRTAYLESLKRFAKEDTDIMLPGHGMIYFHKPRRRVEEALNIALMEWR